MIGNDSIEGYLPLLKLFICVSAISSLKTVEREAIGREEGKRPTFGTKMSRSFAKKIQEHKNHNKVRWYNSSLLLLQYNIDNNNHDACSSSSIINSVLQ